MLDRILVPLDGSPRAEQALERLRPLHERAEAEVLLVRAAGAGQSAREEALAYLERTSSRLRGEGLAARPIVAEGHPAEAVLDTAERERVDLIALTSHGSSGVRRWVFGSVAGKVLRASAVPVLLFRSFEAPESGGAVFRKILMPTDGSDHSLAAVPLVTWIGRLFNSEILVLYADAAVHAVQPAFATAFADPIPPAPLPLISSRGAENARRVAAMFIRDGFRVEARAVEGDPARCILDAAREEAVGLIVMSTHGRSGVTRWVFGSVTEKVLGAAEAPVLIVRPVARLPG